MNAPNLQKSPLGSGVLAYQSFLFFLLFVALGTLSRGGFWIG